jgi:hemerythrin
MALTHEERKAISVELTGHNNPPGMIETIGEVTTSLNDWLTDHPVVEDENMARDAKVLLDRGRLGLKDLEDERTRKVRPLNEQVEEINASYRPSRSLLQKVLDELLRRANDFLAKEEAKRIKIAEEDRQRAELARSAALEAEQREQDIIDDAKAGAIVDVLGASEDADRLYAEYRLADRGAARSDKEIKVRIGGGIGRPLSLRNKETLTIMDACSAITAMSVDGRNADVIDAAILKTAKLYRSVHGRLPPGIESKTERA